MNKEEQLTNFLMTLNQIIMAILVLSIILNVTQDLFNGDTDHGVKNTLFFPVKMSSVFMWGGFSSGYFV